MAPVRVKLRKQNPRRRVVGAPGVELPQVCHHSQLGPIQTCDTCIVEVNGELVRACGVETPNS
jgi:formate dehydrogenase major subunit